MLVHRVSLSRFVLHALAMRLLFGFAKEARATSEQEQEQSAEHTALSQNENKEYHCQQYIFYSCMWKRDLYNEV